jgi:cytochrome b561
MQIRNNADRYGAVAVTLHWLIALAILGLLVVGFVMEDMPNGPDKFALIGIHKSFGITVLALAILRILWRLMNKTPTLPAAMPRWQVHAAKLAHLGLYALMIAMPLSGWGISSSLGYEVSPFGLFTLPALVAKSEPLSHFFGETHELLANGIIALLLVHAGAAIYHHHIVKDNVLRSMAPWIKKA